MMTENEVIIKTIELFNAAKNNNITEVEEIVNYLNNNFEPSDLIPALNGFLPFERVFDKTTNESLFYILDNLIYLDQKDKIKWDINIKELRKNNNKQEIKEFIIQFIDKELFDWQLNDLISLCVFIGDLNLVSKF